MHVNRLPEARDHQPRLVVRMGPLLRGKAGDLALALCGLAVPPGLFEGDSL
jgi:hypothetical protein